MRDQCPSKAILSKAIIVWFLLTPFFTAGAQSLDNSLKGAGYWASTNPPRAHYTIECQIGPSSGLLSGAETIRFINTTSKPIHRLALDWVVNKNQTLEITIHEKPVPILADSSHTDLPSPLLFELPEALLAGEQVELKIGFKKTLSTWEGKKMTVVKWHPRLWWGFRTHDDYDVRIQTSPDYLVATTGLLDVDTRYYHAEDVRSFGLFLGKGLRVMESNAGDVLVRTVFTDKGEECARLLHSTAVDAINFYRERFGFYPYKTLTVVPGGDRPMGGYPVATGVVAIHGQERMDEVPKIHWQWITAHEIGHQYWGEYVLEKDNPGWLWIGLGIYADREYVRGKGLSLEKHHKFMERYINAVSKHVDTTVEITPEQRADLDFDFNNVVIHGKGFSIISALACVLGRETFDRIYQRCLEQFGGRRLGAYGFQVVCEEETGQDLGWFFDQWLRSSRYPSYQITSQVCTKHNDGYLSRVRVESLGTLKMPVPIVAYFEDDTYRRRLTDRLLDVNILEFASPAPLREVRLDPDDELALVIPPPGPPPMPTTKDELEVRIRRMPLTGAEKEALDLFTAAQELNLTDPDFWLRLGLALYDGSSYPKALIAWRRVIEFAEGDLDYSFISLVWQGHILDLLGRRQDAVQKYKEALNKDTGSTFRHDQYRMVINRQWVEYRLEKPFERE